LAPGARIANVKLSKQHEAAALLTPETLGERVKIVDGRAIKTEWALGHLMLVSDLPDSVRVRFGLDGFYLVMFDLTP
jgi:hypothetical protein